MSVHRQAYAAWTVRLSVRARVWCVRMNVCVCAGMRACVCVVVCVCVFVHMFVSVCACGHLAWDVHESVALAACARMYHSAGAPFEIRSRKHRCLFD
jgi:hypothetical protein